MEVKILSQLGLNESEVKVYFALLELDSSTVGPIIEKARISDSKIYNILKKLKEKGLVSFVVKNNVKHFQASGPENLLQLLEEKKREIEEQESKLKKEIIPYIKERRKLTREKQEAIVYESLEGFKSAFNYLLEQTNSGDEYYVFTLGEELQKKQAIFFFNNYHKKRVEKKVKVKFISPENQRIPFKKYHNYKLMQVKFSRQKLPTGTFIFKNHVMTLIWGDEPVAFIIKSKINYEHYKLFFENMWDIAKK